MKLVFRVDSTAAIGSGHAMRVLALANMLVGKCDLVLATRDMPRSLMDLFSQIFVSIFRLDIENIKDEAMFLKGKFPDAELVVLDGYSFDLKYQSAMKNAGFRVAVIDDFGGGDFNADIIINHSPAACKSDYDVEPNTRLCLGVEYAILRPSFIDSKKKYKDVKRNNNVFISMGSVDADDVTSKILSLVHELDSHIEMNVVVGGLYPHKDALFNYANDSELKITIHVNVSEDEMCQIMHECMIGITTASTVSMEACSSLLPLIVGYAVDNQYSIYKGLVENGLALGIDSLNEINHKKFNENVSLMLNDDNVRHAIREKQHLAFSGVSQTNLQNCLLGN